MRNPGAEWVRPQFVSVVRFDGVAVEVLAEAVLLPGIVQMHFLGFKDGNGDDYPEFTGVDRSHSGRGGVAASLAMDVRNKALVRLGWGYGDDESLPKPAALEGARYVDEQVMAYLDVLIPNLDAPAVSEVIEFDDSGEGDANHVQMRSWDLAVTPTDLCTGYATSALISLSLRVGDAPLGDCELEVTLEAMREFTAPFLAEIESAEGKPEAFNSVRATALGSRMIQTYQRLPNTLSLVPDMLPPWQRATFRDWAATASPGTCCALARCAGLIRLPSGASCPK